MASTGESMSTAALNLQELIKGRQNNRILRLSFPHNDGPDAELVVNSLEASEALSRDFEFTVELLSDNPLIELKDLQGKLLCVELVRKNGGLRFFTGYVFSFRLVKADGKVAFYEAGLGPWFKYLSLRKDNFLFHNATLREQTDAIFRDYLAHPDWDARIYGEDPAMTDACQFDESDFNYLSRRWEAAGWHYSYVHSATGHKLVLSDDSTRADPIDGDVEIPFQRHAGAREEDGIGEWSPVRHLMPASVELSSFNFKSPRPVNANIPTINKQGKVLRVESYEYAGAYGFKNRADGERLARQRMVELEAAGKHVEAEGNNRDVLPDRWFRLTGHFDASLFGGDDQAREFLIVHVRHSASNNYHVSKSVPALYANRFTCIRKIIPWHPGRGYNSTEPKIYGLQTAIVVGPKGEEIHTDEYGRVRVQFHWDRVGELDERSSAWLRVATAWAGARFGMTSIPRVGTEVLVSFLDGNPDRGLIIGMVPNAANMPPWELPANKTQSGILSRSTPGGAYGHANAIRFEDKKGKEQLWLHAEKDQLTEVEHDEDKWVGHDRRKTVDHDETSHIKHDRTETVDHDETITVHNNRGERVDHDEKVSIGDNRDEDVGKDETIHIGGNRSVTVDQAKFETITLAKVMTIGGAYQTTVGAGMNTSVGLMQAEQVGQSKTVTVGETFTITVGEQLKIVVGACTVVMNADGRIHITGKEIILSGNKKVEIHGDDVDTNPAS
jgi:type VI secretion system secreted protein VgrG